MASMKYWWLLNVIKASGREVIVVCVYLCISHHQWGRLHWHSCAVCRPALEEAHTYSKTFPVCWHTDRQSRSPHSHIHYYLQEDRETETSVCWADMTSIPAGTDVVKADRCTPADPCRSRIHWDSNRRSRECCWHTRRLYTPPGQTAYTHPHLSGEQTHSD